MTSYTAQFLAEVVTIAQALDHAKIDRMVQILAETRAAQGRVFFIGVGGSAGNASHAVNDFRKIAGIECYAPTDNVSELTARTNDEGWETVFSKWLEVSHVNAKDTICVFSVGGGNVEKNISANIVAGLKTAKAAGAKVIGIVGRDGGYTAQVADAAVIIPVVNDETITPHSEAFQAVVWHLMVTHPELKANAMKWESSAAPPDDNSRRAAGVPIARPAPLMVFLNYWFVAAVPIFFGAYWLVRPLALRRYVLLVGCGIFHYHFAGPAGVLPIVALGLLTYVCGLIGGRIAPVIGIAASAAMLIAYKYTMFLAVGIVGLVSPQWGAALAAEAQGLLPELPPLGLSFFAFEFAHYLIEVRRGHARITSPISFALFAIFWPSLVAGPIKRYPQFLATVHDGIRRIGSSDVAAGLLRLTSGLLKKFVADYLTQLITFWVPLFPNLTLPQRWGILAAIALRILFDFSGYTDMAIGFARMMGMRLPENFNWPYLATSPTEFWRRWHISLSSWIRDYIYVPLGGSRHGTPRRILNGLIAFAICGLWHGAAWNFALWGLYHGAGLALSSGLGTLIRDRMPPRTAWQGPVWLAASGVGAVGGWILTQLFVMIGWLLFFYPVGTAATLARQLVVP